MEVLSSEFSGSVENEDAGTSRVIILESLPDIRTQNLSEEGSGEDLTADQLHSTSTNQGKVV